LYDRQLQAKMLQTSPEIEPPLVAVVDDDSAVCNSLKFSLELEGFKVHTYGSGSELLHAKDIGVSDCFVIDQKMPGMTGLELIGKLRDRHISAPAILIISEPSVGLSARAAKANVPIVEKPFLSNALLDRIRDACAQGKISGRAS
jgi:FixJ family two-component response regulator